MADVMRTRVYTHMLNSEVEEYLQRSDIIFIPIGVIEAAGVMPLDAEYVFAEGFALKMAEAADGLVFNNLSYFFSGGTSIGRGTVQMGIVEGTRYLEQIALSLYKQGFKRQVYITAHGPGYISCSALVRDFFEKYKVPIMHLNMHKAFEKAGVTKAVNGDMSMAIKKFIAMQFACYDIMGKLDQIPVDIPVKEKMIDAEEAAREKHYSAIADHLNSFSYTYGGCGFYQPSLSTHAIAGASTAEDRKSLAAEGRAYVDEVMEAIQISTLMDELTELREFSDKLLEQHSQLRPFC